MSTTQWWYSTAHEIVAYVSEDGKCYYDKSGEPKAYRGSGNWIYNINGSPLGYLDADEKWVYDLDGKPLWYRG